MGNARRSDTVGGGPMRFRTGDVRFDLLRSRRTLKCYQTAGNVSAREFPASQAPDRGLAPHPSRTSERRWIHAPGRVAACGRAAVSGTSNSADSPTATVTVGGHVRDRDQAVVFRTRSTTIAGCLRKAEVRRAGPTRPLLRSGRSRGTRWRRGMRAEVPGQGRSFRSGLRQAESKDG